MLQIDLKCGPTSPFRFNCDIKDVSLATIMLVLGDGDL